MQPTSSYKRIFVILVMLLLLLVAGLLIWMLLRSGFGSQAEADESFFDSEIAMVNGTITDIGENSVTLENTKGIKKTLSLSPAFTVILNNEEGLASPSADLSKVEVGKQYSFNLSLGTERTLEVTTIMQSNGEPSGFVAPELVSPPPAIEPAATQRPATPSARNAAPAANPEADEDTESE